MGDMVVTGGFGRVDSVGHVPDQGMMIYLRSFKLLDNLRGLLMGNARVLTYNGADTSFGLED